MVGELGRDEESFLTPADPGGGAGGMWGPTWVREAILLAGAVKWRCEEPKLSGLRFDLAPKTRYRVAMTTSALSDRIFAAFLFDMDGTIINSMEATERVWSAWARRHGIDLETFLPTIHGVRGIDTISRLQLPGLDPHAEARDVLLAEIEDVAGVAAIAGAASFLASLPENRWAIVTSAPRELAIRRLGLPACLYPRCSSPAKTLSMASQRRTASFWRPNGSDSRLRIAWCSRTPRPASRPPKLQVRVWLLSRPPIGTFLRQIIQASWVTRHSRPNI